MLATRLGYADSIRRLRDVGLISADVLPPMRNCLPQPEDDEPLGLSFYRTFVGEGVDLSNLTIPRTFFGRSEINQAIICNTDLTESNLRWNDFFDIDFTNATLTRADLRASNYERVNFTRADLCGSDMRLASFHDCVFDDAAMEGAVLTRKQGMRLRLSGAQKAAIAWCDNDGPEPSGG